MTESVDERDRKLLARRRELRKRPEAKAKQAAYMREFRKRGYCKRPDVLAKKHAHYSEYCKRPDVLAKKHAHYSEYYKRPEVKARVLAYQRERFKRPEVKAKRRLYRMRPETKVLHKEYDRQWHKRNPAWNKPNMDRFRQKRNAWLADLKANSSCSICGQSFPDHPSVIDFHHRSGQSKESGITAMKLRSMSKVKAEVDKCMTVCANCHRIIHHKQRKGNEKPLSNEIPKDRRQWYSMMKAAQTCSVCGRSFPDYPFVIEFHHKGGSKKEGEVSSMARRRAVPLGQVQAEIDKCIAVCANCHRIVHDSERRKRKVA